MKIILIVTTLLLSISTSAQTDSLLTFTKILTFDSLTKDQIFDRAMIWCSQRFKESKSAINVSTRESGIISGKAYIEIKYKFLKSKDKDSTSGLMYTNYIFNWLVETKAGKLRFSISEPLVYFGDLQSPYRYPVTISDKPPTRIPLSSKERSLLEWIESKRYFVVKLDAILAHMKSEIQNKEYNW